jgi:hypothetical protein
MMTLFEIEAVIGSASLIVAVVKTFVAKVTSEISALVGWEGTMSMPEADAHPHTNKCDVRREPVLKIMSALPRCA